MTNSFALRNWISDRGYKLKAIAFKLNITPYSLKKKIDNETEFKASEIAAFVNDFGMSVSDRDSIFFSQE
jgi:hypothetical protein